MLILGIDRRVAAYAAMERLVLDTGKELLGRSGGDVAAQLGDQVRGEDRCVQRMADEDHRDDRQHANDP